MAVIAPPKSVMQTKATFIHCHDLLFFSGLGLYSITVSISPILLIVAFGSFASIALIMSITEIRYTSFSSFGISNIINSPKSCTFESWQYTSATSLSITAFLPVIHVFFTGLMNTSNIPPPFMKVCADFHLIYKKAPAKVLCSGKCLNIFLIIKNNILNQTIIN
ncbi:hypothetical protein SDC9_136207 [bioreactor metagenome]|uniref:Uncharacterized protein n=1 Tax=bioreactor metagenome TaxID=1076179 RepID=A0A645DII0_9ZZZZ